MLKNDLNSFVLSNNGNIKIGDEALLRMLKYRQNKLHKLEGGGVLLGRLILNSKNIVVDFVTIPMIGDKRGRTSFFRSEKMHQKIIDRRWADSKGTCNYLGEWHTHPETNPNPSDIDWDSWKKKLKQGIFSSRYLYFIILGIDKLNIWEGDRNTLKFKKLK